MDGIQGEGAAFVLLGGLDGSRTGRYGRRRPDSARMAVRSSDFRASMKLSTQSGQVESVVVFVAKIVTTTLPSKGSWPSASSSGSLVQVPGSLSLAR